MKPILLLSSLAVFQPAPITAQAVWVHNEEGLRAECPNRSYDEADRACQVRTLLAELRAVSADLNRKNELALKTESKLSEEICIRFSILIELYKARLELAALKSEPEDALRQAEQISLVERQIEARNCSKF